MRQLVHVEKRGKWCEPGGHDAIATHGPWGKSDVCCSPRPTVAPVRECACGALSDSTKPMPLAWRDHLVGGEHVFTCSELCRLQKGLRS